MIERLVLQREAHDGIILPGVILKRKAGKETLYFKILEKNGAYFTAQQVDVSRLRRFKDRLFKW